MLNCHMVMSTFDMTESSIHILSTIRQADKPLHTLTLAYTCVCQERGATLTSPLYSPPNYLHLSNSYQAYARACIHWCLRGAGEDGTLTSCSWNSSSVSSLRMGSRPEWCTPTPARSSGSKCFTAPSCRSSSLRHATALSNTSCTCSRSSSELKFRSAFTTEAASISHSLPAQAIPSGLPKALGPPPFKKPCCFQTGAALQRQANQPGCDWQGLNLMTDLLSHDRCAQQNGRRWFVSLSTIRFPRVEMDSGSSKYAVESGGRRKATCGKS